MKNECVRRLNLLGLSCVKEFENGRVLVSDNGILRGLDIEEFAVVDDLQERYGMLIYHVIKDELGFTILFVSSYEEDWEFERPEIKNNKVYAEAYCYNETESYLSEFGSVDFELNKGVLKRIR